MTAFVLGDDGLYTVTRAILFDEWIIIIISIAYSYDAGQF